MITTIIEEINEIQSKQAKEKEISKAKNWFFKGRMKLINAKHGWSNRKREKIKLLIVGIREGKLLMTPQTVKGSSKNVLNNFKEQIWKLYEMKESHEKHNLPN